MRPGAIGKSELCSEIAKYAVHFRRRTDQRHSPGRKYRKSGQEAACGNHQAGTAEGMAHSAVERAEVPVDRIDGLDGKTCIEKTARRGAVPRKIEQDHLAARCRGNAFGQRRHVLATRPPAMHDKITPT